MWRSPTPPNSSGNVQKHGHLLRFQVNGRQGKISGVHVIQFRWLNSLWDSPGHTSLNFCCFPASWLVKQLLRSCRQLSNGWSQIWGGELIMGVPEASEIQNHWFPHGSLGPMGHDPYGPRALGMGPIIDSLGLIQFRSCSSEFQLFPGIWLVKQFNYIYLLTKHWSVWTLIWWENLS